MKRRVLNPTVRETLTFITTMQVLCIITLQDFELRAVPFILAHIALTLTNIKILKKF